MHQHHQFKKGLLGYICRYIYMYMYINCNIYSVAASLMLAETFYYATFHYFTHILHCLPYHEKYHNS